MRAANTNVAVDACAAGQNDQTDTITVPAGTYTLTVAGNDNDAAGGDLDLRDNAAVDDLVISGAGATTTIIQACAVEQQSADCPAGQGVVDRVFHVIDAHVAISGVTVRHGRALPSTASGSGSGVVHPGCGAHAAGRAHAHRRRRHEERRRRRPGRRRRLGGGIANGDGALTLTRVTVSDNVLYGGLGGGGIYVRKNAGGVPRSLVMTDST